MEASFHSGLNRLKEEKSCLLDATRKDRYSNQE